MKAMKVEEAHQTERHASYHVRVTVSGWLSSTPISRLRHRRC
jgi:hypothetical protein